MEPVSYTTHHLVKNEDLNHHGTLYAGRTAEWFVEAGFVAEASITSPESTVCLTIHGMKFSRSVHRGDIVCFKSKVILAGKSSLVTHIQMSVKEEVVVDGFITFIHVDQETHSLAHGIVITPVTSEDIALQERARSECSPAK